MSTRRSTRPAADAAHAARPVVFARAASYARTAVGGADVIAAQHAANRAAAARHGYTIIGEYSDDGRSGASFRRPGLDALLAAVAAGDGALTRVYVADRARLGRFADPRDLDALIERFARRGVEVVTGSGPAPHGRTGSDPLA